MTNNHSDFRRNEELNNLCGDVASSRGRIMQSVPQEGVDGGAGVHESVGEDGGGVAHAVACLHRVLDLFQHQQVRVRVRRQELKVQADGCLPGEDGAQLVPPLLVLCPGKPPPMGVHVSKAKGAEARRENTGCQHTLDAA